MDRLCISRDTYEEYIMKVEEDKEMVIEHMSRYNIKLKRENEELKKKVSELLKVINLIDDN